MHNPAHTNLPDFKRFIAPLDLTDPSGSNSQARLLAEKFAPIGSAFVNNSGEWVVSLTETQLTAVIAKAVQIASAPVLIAMDGLHCGCKELTFRGIQNGLGDEAGDALQDAREALEKMVGHSSIALVELVDCQESSI